MSAPDRMLTRIGGLLRKAEATDNEHEAEAFMAAAQRLATKSSIDLAVARSHIAGREKRATPIQRIIPIGEAGRKGLRTYVQLFVAIASANDVRCDVARTSTQVYAYGFAADIDACEALYASLIVQMVRASDHFIKSGAYREATVSKVVVEKRFGRTVRRRVEAPVAAVTARLNFQMAFASRVGVRLAEARAEVVAEETGGVPGAAGSGAGVSRRGGAEGSFGQGGGPEPGASGGDGSAGQDRGAEFGASRRDGRGGPGAAGLDGGAEFGAAGQERGAGFGTSDRDGAGSAGASGAETALALRDKEVALTDFYRATSEARGTWRGPQASTGHSAAARRAGDKAGRSARLGMSPELPGAKGQLGG
ncbi:DUF2786 domain-containing protein [Nocardia camponoti]|uniref:DUF2786 domain-containing protein n=1 Tax=Nocardia camponoti TaxID=1616106 RepID=A0A917QJN3_9NOCA|nr:hypothetical protein GCM10011591_26770 [Nocardia camponoti]